MYSSVTGLIVAMADGLVMATMTEEKAIATLEKMTDQDRAGLAEALRGLIPQVKEGTPPVVTAALSGPAKTFMLALMTLAPAIFADPVALEQTARQLKAPVNIEQVKKINNDAKKDIQTENQKKIDRLKKMIQEKGKEGPAVKKIFIIKNIPYSAANQKQEKILRTLAGLAKILAYQESKKIITPEQYETLMSSAMATVDEGLGQA